MTLVLREVLSRCNPRRLALFRWASEARIVFSIALFASLIGASGYLAVRERHAAIAKAQTDCLLAANILAEHLHQIVQVSDIGMTLVTKSILADGEKPAFRHARNLVIGFPDLAGIARADAKGDLLWDTGWDVTPKVNFASRPSFQKLSAGTNFLISGLVPGPNTGKPLISVGRALHDPNGAFDGVIYAPIYVSSIQRMFTSPVLPAGSAAALFHQDGTLFVHHPATYLGENFTGGQPFARSDGAMADLLVGQDPHSGETRLGAYVDLKDYPLTVTVTRPQSVILSDWRDYLLKLSAMNALAAAMLLIFNLHDSRRQRALNEALETTRRDAEELRIAAVAFDSQEGILVTDRRRQILRANPAFVAMTRYDAKELIRRNASDLRLTPHTLHTEESAWESADHHGQWQGEVWVRRKSGSSILVWLCMTATRDVKGVVSHYVLTMTDFTARKAAEEEIQRLAFYDPLTELPNRRYLVDRLHRAIASSARSGREGALIFIDLDHFKTLNDTLGHSFGDMLLKQVGARLSTCVREGDTVARLGGDEFVVLLENLGESADEAEELTETVSRKILSMFILPFELSDQIHHTTASIGATLLDGQRSTVDELLRRADIAMYEAKASGRNAVCFFDPEVKPDVTRH